jgi:conjugative transfer region protein TrbK
MITNKIERFPTVAAVICVVLVVAACAIQLRGDEDQMSSVASAPASDLMAAKLKECRAVTDEQKEALLACKKIWAEKRQQFLGRNVEIVPDPSRSPPSVAPPPVPEGE